jgi:hypothetical protein
MNEKPTFEPAVVDASSAEDSEYRTRLEEILEFVRWQQESPNGAKRDSGFNLVVADSGRRVQFQR